MQMLLKFQKVVADILGLLVVILMFLIVIDVGGRYIFNSPLKGGIEISEILMTWLLCLPLAYALVRETHVRVTMAVTHLPPRPKLIIDLLGTGLSLVFFSLITYVSWINFWDSFSRGETMAATIWLPLWLQKLALPLGFFLFSLQLCANLAVQIKKLGKDQNEY